MTHIFSRANKILVGTLLILSTMFWSSSVAGIVILPLIAIPIIISGMFDWRPLEYLVGKIISIGKSSVPTYRTRIGSA